MRIVLDAQSGQREEKILGSKKQPFMKQEERQPIRMTAIKIDDERCVHISHRIQL